MRSAFAIAFILICHLSVSTAALAQAVVRDYRYVTKVNVGQDNHLYITVAGNFSPDHGCTNHSYVRSSYPLSDDRTKAWLQMATASFLSQSKVHVWTRGCNGGANVDYPIMIGLQMFQ